MVDIFRRSELRQLLELQEKERQMFANEIHDGLTQQLAGAIMLMQAYQRHLPEKPDEAQEEFDKGLELLGQAMAESRRLMSRLRPPVLDDSGVVTAIENLVWEARAKGDVVIEFHNDVEFDRFAAPLENVVYRIVQEGLANAQRHSQSDRVLIKLSQQGDCLCLEVRDWGVGFDPTALAEARGLYGVCQRTRIFGGQARVESSPGQGTCIHVELPILNLDG